MYLAYGLYAWSTVAKNRASRCLRERLTGQGMVEYVLIIALIAIACIVVMQVLSGELGTKFNAISDVLHSTSTGTNPGPDWYTPGA